MERLTFEGNFCDIVQCSEVPGGSFCEDGACYQKKVWERLKQFEDTVRAPELFFKMYGEFCLLESALKNYGSHDRMKELAKADKEDRLVVLPTKPGAHVFVTGKRKIVECIVDSIYIDQRGAEAIMNFECDSDCGGCPFYSPLPDPEGEFRCAGELEEAEIVLERFWKIVFTTREEAEKALAEMEGKKDG